MKVVSLFDGISCGRVALEYAGLPVTEYYAYEIEPNAIICSTWNWPDIIQCGSVVGADFSKHKGADIVMGGFPCTDLSIAKEGRKGLAGEHSKLFWEQVRAIKEIQPKYFLVENNYGMPQKDMDIITATLGVEPIYINSALVSAQNRRRLYWTNIPGVQEPEDELIILSDILEERVPLKYYHTKGGLNYISRDKRNTSTIQHPERDKAYTVTANYARGAGYNNIAFPCAIRTWPRVSRENRHKRPEIREDVKSNALLTGSTENMIVQSTPYRVANLTLQGRQGERVYSADAKATAIIANATANGRTGLYAVDAYPDVPVFAVSGGLMTYGENSVKVKLPDGLYALRKLTPLECERLQTLPDHYTDMIADTHRYKTLGNGWTAKVIAHILGYIHHAELL